MELMSARTWQSMQMVRQSKLLTDQKKVHQQKTKKLDQNGYLKNSQTHKNLQKRMVNWKNNFQQDLKKKKEEVQEGVKIPEPSKEPESKRVQTLDKFYDEYAETGSLTDKSYKELSKQGLNKELVDGYISGQKALAENHTKAIQDTVGGKEKYGDLITRAGKNLSETEQSTFNNLVEGGTLDEAKFAVQGLMMKSGMSFNPKQPELFEGTSDLPSTDAYESVSQVTDAMNDPRYEKDPTFRKKVTDKLARSTVI